uniref:Uncharacterized protein n=1 Tax=Salmo trutta TaxID=8032 RepID=A0A673WLB5_SALTR
PNGNMQIMLELKTPVVGYLTSNISCYHLSRVPTMVGWGSVGGVALVHFTDWRLILDCVPYINGKFKDN